MKRQKKQKQSYITIPYQGTRPEWVAGVSTEELLAANGTNIGALGSVEISYTLERIASDLATGPYCAIPNSQNQSGASSQSYEGPCVLIAGRGEHAKRAIRVARDAGLIACAVYADSERDAAYVRLASKSVSIGAVASDALFLNNFSILKACEISGAQAVLVLDSSLSEDKRFCDLCYSKGIAVFRAITPSIPQSGWLMCDGVDTDSLVSWRKCPHCGLFFDEQSLAANHFICPACSGAYRMSPLERINGLLDADSFTQWNKNVQQTDPLDFAGYTEKIEAARVKTGVDEAVCCGEGSIAGVRLALAIMDSQFFMGSMGSAVGEKIARTVERATDEDLPLVIFTASGGARMQEGLASLMQMAKVSCALSRHSEAGKLYISILTDPTTGGVTASFAMQGDIVLAEPKALIGFAGQRVIKDTIKQELPAGFQTAEFALAHGLIDAIVPRDQLRERIAHLLAVHEATMGHCSLKSGEALGYAAISENLSGESGTYNTVAYGMMPHIRHAFSTASQRLMPGLPKTAKRAVSRKSRKQQASQRRLAALLRGSFDAEDGLLLEGGEAFDAAPKPTDRITLLGDRKSSAWDNVKLARNTHRPTALHYIESFVDGFIELHGDRSFGDDGAIVGGVGWIGSHPVTVIAQEKGTDLKQRLARNFGCPQPEGYRKSLRLMKQAEKFGRPIVCLVDTQGAFCGMEAEERGQGNAIAENLMAMAGIKVPIISVLIGEGGSGGALALALADRVAMQEHAVYSVLSPEGFASILWKDRSRAPEAAAAMKMSAEEACEMGIVDAVLAEGPAPAHVNPDTAAAVVRGYVLRSLEELELLQSQQLVDARYARFRKF